MRKARPIERYDVPVSDGIRKAPTGITGLDEITAGLSDGATYSLLRGLAEKSPFTALAPVAGALHPAVMAEDRLAAAKGRRIYLVHGARDWLFPVAAARVTRDVLTRAGADLTYREIGDLSHTYPREENDRILTWFDPALALP